MSVFRYTHFELSQMDIDSNSDELDSDSSNKDGLLDSDLSNKDGLDSDLSCATILKGIYVYKFSIVPLWLLELTT